MTDEKKPLFRSSKLKKLIIFGLIFGFVVTLLPFGMQSGISTALKKQGLETVALDDVDFNLFTGELVIKKLTAQRTSEPELSIHHLRVVVDWLPMFNKQLFISSLSLKDSTITIQQADDTELFIAGIHIPQTKEEPKQQEANASSWGFGLDKLLLNNNTVKIDSPDFTHDVVISDLSLDDVFSWEPDHRSDIALNTTLNGATIIGDVQFTAFDDTPAVKGTLTIEGFALATVHPFIKQHVSDLTGLLSTQLTFSLNIKDNTVQYQQSGPLSIKNATATLPELQLKHDDLTWDGTIEFKQLTDAMHIGLQGKLSSSNHQHTLTSPPLQTNMAGFQWKGNAQIKTSNNKPSITANGGIVIDSFSSKSTNTNITVAAIEQLNLKQLTLNELDDITLADTQLTDTLLVAKDDNTPLVLSKKIAFDSLQINKLSNFSLSKTSLDSLTSSLHINEQGQLTTLNDLTKSLSPSGDEHGTQKNNDSKSTHFNVEGIELTGNNQIRIKKQTTTGTVNKTIAINTLKIGKIDTQQTALNTPIQLKATVDKHSSIESKGNISLFSPKLNATFKSTLQAFELPDYSPIISEHIGYDIQTGQLNASSNLRIKQDMLDGETTLNINQLALVSSNEQVASKLTQQLSMPLDSALSLLRDDNDDIELSIPIKGDIKSPDFNISDVINTALGNALQGTVKSYLKYALQPYGLIFMAAEKAYGAATAIKLDAVEFQPSHSELTAEASNYLKKIGTMLQKRPGLRIKLCGFSTDHDRLTTDEKKPSEPSPNTDDEKRLLALANDRAQAVKSHFVQHYNVKPSRLFSCTPTIDAVGQKSAPRVELSI